MALQWMIPKKFLCRFPLKLGAIVYGVLMIFVMISSIIAVAVEMLEFTTCDESYSMKRSAYAFCTIIIIYSVIMIVIHLWFLWSIKKAKASVILVCVVVNALWLAQSTLLTIVLLCFYSRDTSFIAWIVCVVCEILGFVICLYGVLVGYGLWIQMKSTARITTANIS